MPAFIMNCPSCGNEIEAETSWIGTPTQCPVCQKLFLTPDPRKKGNAVFPEETDHPENTEEGTGEKMPRSSRRNRLKRKPLPPPDRGVRGDDIPTSPHIPRIVQIQEQETEEKAAAESERKPETKELPYGICAKQFVHLAPFFAALTFLGGIALCSAVLLWSPNLSLREYLVAASAVIFFTVNAFLVLASASIFRILLADRKQDR